MLHLTIQKKPQSFNLISRLNRFGPQKRQSPGSFIARVGTSVHGNTNIETTTWIGYNPGMASPSHLGKNTQRRHTFSSPFLLKQKNIYIFPPCSETLDGHYLPKRYIKERRAHILRLQELAFLVKLERIAYKTHDQDTTRNCM